MARHALDDISNLIQQTGGAASGFDPRAILYAASKNGIPMQQLPSLLQTLKRQPKGAQERLAESRAQFIEEAPEERRGELLGLEPGALEKRLQEAQVTAAEARPGLEERRVGVAERGIGFQEERLELDRQRVENAQENQANTFLRLSSKDQTERDRLQLQEDSKIFTGYMSQVRDFGKTLSTLGITDPDSFKQLQSVVSTATGAMTALRGTSYGYVIGTSAIRQLLHFGVRSDEPDIKEQTRTNILQLLTSMYESYDPETMKPIEEEILGALGGGQ